MSEQDRGQELDRLISRAINSTRPEFDPEGWRHRYPDEFQALVSRSARRQPGLLSRAAANPIVRFAAAAAIIVATIFCVVEQNSHEPKCPDIARGAKSPAEMMTSISLRIAHRHGGIEAVEEQYDEAYRLLGPRPAGLSVEKILAEFNGT
jgi:hypothetical protein